MDTEQEVDEDLEIQVSLACADAGMTAFCLPRTTETFHRVNRENFSAQPESVGGNGTAHPTADGIGWLDCGRECAIGSERYV